MAESHPALRYGASVEVRPWAATGAGHANSDAGSAVNAFGGRCALKGNETVRGGAEMRRIAGQSPLTKPISKPNHPSTGRGRSKHHRLL